MNEGKYISGVGYLLFGLGFIFFTLFLEQQIDLEFILYSIEESNQDRYLLLILIQAISLSIGIFSTVLASLNFFNHGYNGGTVNMLVKNKIRINKDQDIQDSYFPPPPE